MSRKTYTNFIKPIGDYIVAILLLALLGIPILILWLIISIQSGTNGFFMHERIGQHGKKFKMYKLRSLQGEYSNSVTTEKTHQYLPIGKFLSYSKLDETPQLLNILRGEMSFVGPRPDVAGYADQLEGDDHIILNVKPGITGPAQIKYSREAELLQQQPNPKKYNDEVLWPDKVQINKDYVKNQSFSQDLFYLLATIFPLQ